MWEMTTAVNLKTNCNLDYPGMKVISIRIVSTACIICGIASIVTQTAALAIFLETFDRHYVNFPSDVVGHGICGGTLYLMVGGFGIAVTYMRKKTLLVATVIMTAISIFASLVTALLSAGAASSGVYSSCYRKFGYSHSICDTWLELQWALMGCGIFAFISSTSLVILTSGSLCTCCRKHNGIADMIIIYTIISILLQRPRIPWNGWLTDANAQAATFQGTYVGEQIPDHELQ